MFSFCFISICFSHYNYLLLLYYIIYKILVNQYRYYSKNTELLESSWLSLVDI